MRSNPGFHTTMVGQVAVTALNDGQFEAGFGVVAGPSAEHAAAMLHESFRVAPPRITVSCFLLEWSDRRALIDFGAGRAFSGVLGHAGTTLAALGVAPESIDDVLLTHGHIDHVGGLMTVGAPTFARATLHVNEAEAAYWATQEGEANHADVTRAVLAAYGPRTSPFRDEAEVLPGVTALHLPGHTPGHSGFVVRSEADALFVWADVVHLPGIQFAMPSAGVAFDVDGDAGRSARMRAMDMAAADRLLVAGNHLDFPLFGHVARHGEGYAFEPLVWAPTAAGPFG